jgi:protein TonB
LVRVFASSHLRVLTPSRLRVLAVQNLKLGIFLWILTVAASQVKTNAMNPKEILTADLLDIVFEGRNKDYGAYELRRRYAGRLRTAMLAMIVTAGLIIGAVTLQSAGKNEIIAQHPDKGPHILTYVDETPDVAELTPPPQAQTQPHASEVQERMFTSTINIRPNNTALNSLPSQAALSTAIPSDKTRTGVPPGDLPRLPSLTRPTVKVTASPSEPQAAFVPDEIEAGFPGGADALREFMMSNLVTPDDLAPGDKKTVHIRFNIDPEGKVSSFEIVQSAGYEYDQEVLRVCKKMPKWKPARQNGVYVNASFMLPVSFVSEE